MSEAVVTLSSAAIAWLAVLVVSSIVAGILYPVFAKAKQLSSPETRANATLAYSLLPLCIATLTSVLLYFPALSAMVLVDHCHDASCAPHAPSTRVDAAVASIILAAIAATVAWLLWSPLIRLWRYLRRTRLVMHLTTPSAQGNFRIVDSETPLAWCSGLFRPEVYISQGLIQQLSSQELALIAAHERSHAARYDNLAQLCIDWLTLFWPRAQRAAACQDFRVNAELSCDRAAAPDQATAQQVAALLKKLGDVNGESTELHLQQRLQALQATKVTSDELANFNPWFIIGALWLAGAYLSTHGVHVMLERLFN